MNPVVLSDGIVTLREFRHADSLRIKELADNEKIAINLRDGFPNPYTIRDAELFVDKYSNQNPPSVFAIEYGGEYVGNIGLHRQTDVYRKSAEIGYFLGEPFWNKGIMTRAVLLICDYGFKYLDIIRIYAGIFEYNLPSMRVLEKCGFHCEAVLEKAVFKRKAFYNEHRYVKIEINQGNFVKSNE